MSAEASYNALFYLVHRHSKWMPYVYMSTSVLTHTPSFNAKVKFPDFIQREGFNVT